MIKDIRPVDTVITIKPDKIDEETDSGLIIPEMVRENRKYQQEYGTLVKAGDGCFSEYSDPEKKLLIPGVRVIYNKYSGIRVKIGDERTEYVLCRDIDITAILEE